MARRALRDEPEPRDSLLSRLNRIHPQVIAQRDAKPPDLADCVADTSEDVLAIVDQPTGTVRSTGLFVRQPQHDNVAIWHYPGACPLANDGQHHSVHVLHVDRTAAPQHACVVNDS